MLTTQTPRDLDKIVGLCLIRSDRLTDVICFRPSLYITVPHISVWLDVYATSKQTPSYAECDFVCVYAYALSALSDTSLCDNGKLCSVYVSWSFSMSM